MKRNILFLLSLCIVLFSCSDSKEDSFVEKPFIVIHDSEIPPVRYNGDSFPISFEANMNWIAESSQSWCSIYPAVGDMYAKNTTVTISSNDTNKDRNCTITITAGGISKNIIINQRGINNTYFIEKMGTLGSLLNQTQKDTITTMILTGEINKADFEVMKRQMPMLRYLDLKDVICEGNKIPDEAFGEYRAGGDGNKEIATIILPKSITTIGSHAFTFCRGLTGQFILPDRLTVIGSNAFNGCSGLTSELILPDGINVIEQAAFAFCRGFTGELIIPDGVTLIQAVSFKYCSGFTGELIIHDGVTEIHNSAFEYCTGLTGLTIGENVLTIKGRAFSGCANISGKVVFPINLWEISEGAFKECNKVNAFRFPHTTPLGYYPNMLPSNATVEVPTSAVATYKSTSGWKEHTIIGY